jgi:hypothetical protein
MKIKILSILFLAVTLTVSAQEGDSVLKSKAGIPILPKKGDWAIGASALPYLEYLGNMFNNTQNNTLKLGNTTLYGRYFLEDSKALRFALSISQSSNLQKFYVADDAALYKDPLSNAKTEDSYKRNLTDYTFNIAYLKYRGYGRLQGFCGAQAGFGFSRTHTYYTYGNPFSTDNTAPTTYNGRLSERVLESDNGITYSVNVGALAGVEYYFLPKICIGGEISLSLSNRWKTQGNSTYERMNNSVVEEFDIADSPKQRVNTSLTTSRPVNYGGSLYLMFHF